MGEEYGMYIEFDGLMPIKHGPYLPIDIDLSIPNPQDPDFDQIDYEFSLGRAMRDENLSLDDVALQSLYQHHRHMRSIESGIHRYTMAGECGQSAVQAYSNVLEAIGNILDYEQHTEFMELFLRLVDSAIEDNRVEYWPD